MTNRLDSLDRKTLKLNRQISYDCLTTFKKKYVDLGKDLKSDLPSDGPRRGLIYLITDDAITYITQTLNYDVDATRLNEVQVFTYIAFVEEWGMTDSALAQLAALNVLRFFPRDNINAEQFTEYRESPLGVAVLTERAQRADAAEIARIARIAYEERIAKNALDW